MYKVILILISIVIYFNSLNCDFVFNDLSAIKSNQDIRSNQTSIFRLFYNDYWGTPIHLESSHKSYRPLTVLTFRFNYSLHQLNPIGYHLVNIFIHTTVTLLFYQFSSFLFQKKYYGFISSLLFVLHPIHTETVTNIVGRAELLSTLFYFLALSSFINGHWVRPTLYTIASLLSKEQGITVLGVYCVHFVTNFHKQSLYKTYKPFVTRLTFIFSIALIIIWFRIWILKGTSIFPVFTIFDNPAFFAPFPTRQLTYFYLPVFNFKLLLFPYSLCCDWTMKSIPLIKSFFDVQNIGSFSFYFFLFFITYRCYQELICSYPLIFDKNNQTRSPILCTILAMLILPFIPASNLFIPIGFVIAEKVLYLPSLGYCLLIVYGFEVLEKNWRQPKLARGLLIITCISFAIKTISRNFDWTNEYTLFISATRVNPTNAKLFNKIGQYYEREANWTLALDYFMKAQKLQPDDLDSKINIARIFIKTGNTKKAENMLRELKRKAKQEVRSNNKRLSTNYLSIWMNLAILISQNSSRLIESEKIYTELLSIRPDYVDAYINFGDILIKKGKINEAILIYEKALKFGQNVGDLCYNLGVAYSLLLNEKLKADQNFFNETQIKKTASYFEQSLLHSLNNKEALINLAIMVQKYSKTLKDFKSNLVKRMVSYVGNDEEQIWFNLALLYSDQYENQKAEFYLRKAIDKIPNFKNALFNLALILIQEQRHFEAELFLTQLLSSYPDHVKSWLLLGDIYIKFKEYEKAEKTYQSILAIDSNHDEANHHLCLIYLKIKKKNIPHKCLKKFRQK